MPGTYKVLYANIILRKIVDHKTVIRTKDGNLGEAFFQTCKTIQVEFIIILYVN